MDRHPSSATSVEVDLDSTRSRLLLAREQCASQSTTEHLRSIGAMPSWLTGPQQTAPQPGAEQPDR
ncbi:MAG: hypothetical protein JWO74_453 [Solirubrobacterales bacterium]|jgi:hypothetical protein|nr:hypothetical protein [Solirubrobacterales bacterium]